MKKVQADQKDACRDTAGIEFFLLKKKEKDTEDQSGRFSLSLSFHLIEKSSGKTHGQERKEKNTNDTRGRDKAKRQLSQI